MALASLLLLGLIARLQGGKHESSVPPVQPDGPVLAEAPGQLPVARGLKGLRFGMTPEEVQAALPGLGDPDALGSGGPGEDGRFDLHSLGLLSELRELLPAEPPGTRLAGETRLGSEPARCLLAFAWQGRLSAMACSLGPYHTEESHRAAERALLTALTAKYGRPRAATPGPGAAYDLEAERRWLWQDAGARLELVSFYDRMNGFVPEIMQTSRLTLKDESAEHLAEVERLRLAAEARQAEAEAARRRAHEEELRRLEHPRVDFGKDL
ncbi:MAG TPA: hypothetical protein PK668_24185 [Myxococcota bacterium]|nr:hypothetical protein [Myxococcota bacterium]HRY95362.1 hypothetical protein [Myxococcota bacterium]HSA22210.1 hypothetical protein [Myxococcota bacterium]